MPIRPHVLLASTSKPLVRRLATPPIIRVVIAPHARYASSETYTQSIAVVGGGITGLTAAYELSKRPDVKVTLYEATERLGGWIQSKHVDVPGGRVLFELGPRTLRPSLPNGILAVALAEGLGLANDMIFTSKDSAAARGRYIYYPDHLVQMPHPSMGILDIVRTVLTEPIFEGLIPSIAGSYLRAPDRRGHGDMSIGAFIARHYGRDVVDNLASAMIHGIYAGDVWDLSVDMIMPEIVMGIVNRPNRFVIFDRGWWKLEDAELVSKWSKTEPVVGEELERRLNGCSTFAFRGGMGQLVTKLVEVLRERENVELRLGRFAAAFVAEDSDQKVEICTTAEEEIAEIDDTGEAIQPVKGQPPELYDQVIQTHPMDISSVRNGNRLLPLNCLHSSSIPSNDVGVVNLYYSNPALLPVHGFGYLIPQSIPFSQNPELALGLVFDSDAVHGQDTVSGTKLTVMLGGRWWRNFGIDPPPSSDQCLEMAKAVVRRHLGIKEEPTSSCATVHRNCIPQYPVSYRKDYLRPDHEMLLGKFHGRVKVAGAWFNGVGVSDCIRGGMDVARAALSTDWRDKTGLEVVSRPLEFAKLEPRRNLQRRQR